jgi:hypothetical protein
MQVNGMIRMMTVLEIIWNFLTAKLGVHLTGLMGVEPLWVILLLTDGVVPTKMGMDGQTPPRTGLLVLVGWAMLGLKTQLSGMTLTGTAGEIIQWEPQQTCVQMWLARPSDLHLVGIDGAARILTEMAGLTSETRSFTNPPNGGTVMEMHLGIE